MKTWTRADIEAILQSNDQAVIRGVLRLYDYQTRDEQHVGHTKHHNNVGFNGADSVFLSSVAEFYKAKGYLTPKQIARARRQVMKYAGQLVNIANELEMKKYKASREATADRVDLINKAQAKIQLEQSQYKDAWI